MPSNLSDIVQITITKETTAIDTASFNIPLVLTTSTAFPERTRVYASVDAVSDDFGGESDVAQVVTKLLSGNTTRPLYVVVGRQHVSSAIYTISQVVVGADYTLTINGETYTHVAGASDTDTDIAEALEEAYGLSPVDGVTVEAEAGSIEITNTSQDVNLTVTYTQNISEDSVFSTEPWGDTIAAIEDENSTWYGAVATTHDPADVLQIAAAIQARFKIFGTSTQDADALTASGDDIISQLSSFNYSRTFAVYSPFANEDYPEAVWLGSQLPMTPGTNTWNFKQAPGVRTANLTDTQKFNLRSKNGNMVTVRNGVAIFEDGMMVNGEWIDEIIFIDWWVARVQEAVFFRLINSRKIPMTRAGATIIESEIRSVCALGVSNGGIADDTPYTVIAPDPQRIPANMRAQRTLGDFRVRFRLAGAVHKVIVDAVVGI